MKVKLNNLTMGFVVPTQFTPGTVPHNKGVAKFPNVTDPSALWHLSYFDQEPHTFMKSVQGYWRTLQPAAQKTYISTIKNWLLKYMEPGEIQAKMMLPDSRPFAAWFYLNLFPEWAVWWTKWHLTTGLREWMQATINRYDNVLDNPKAREDYAEQIKKMVEEHAAEDYLKTVPEDLANKFVATFFKKEIGEIEAASIEQQLKTKKTFFALGIGAVALVGGLALLKKLGK